MFKFLYKAWVLAINELLREEVRNVAFRLLGVKGTLQT